MKLTKFMSLALAATALAPLTPALAADYEPPSMSTRRPNTCRTRSARAGICAATWPTPFKRSYKNSSFSLDDTLFDNNLIGWAGSDRSTSSPTAKRNRRFPAASASATTFNDFLRADVECRLLANDRYSGSAHLVAGYLTPPSRWIRSIRT